MQVATSVKSLISLAKYGNNKVSVSSSQQEECQTYTWSLGSEIGHNLKAKAFHKSFP